MTDAPQVWFVTGSSRGLGRALVEEALAAGHRVVATARDVASLADLVGRHGGQVLAVELDVTDPAAVQAAVDAAVAAFDRIDVVVNNAGYATLAPVEETDLAEVRRQVETVFFGTVHVTKAVLPVLRAQGSGHVVQVGSVGGWVASPGLASYQAAKMAVEGFSAALAQEVGPLGVRVTVLEAGLMRTNWAGSSMQVPAVAPEYEATVGALGGWLRGAQEQAPIDPHRVARVVLDVAAMAEPPLHLPVGSDAVELFPGVLDGLRESIAPWAALGRSVDFEQPATASR
ncbi:SDR family NAD(P)-dependent oxidoreductase [Modestobacter sp. L9-4]|uniref:SDR family NAD(P)-dependent oxidoreductase n=1 Tax=Modestobacter sp. L9-4 TaxID=2851567 RepID=UPI001C74415B|nr:SDR family NAD(P)-dependent oxidoreductase [Modestobacter sp. L9-4]QXG74544.1 SDR family NAD(P)-dependent oxidoreductase [Modestobacter sp. L9-4]